MKIPSTELSSGNLIFKALTSSHNQQKWLYAFVILLGTVAFIWLGYEFWRLLFQTGEMGAIDLRQRHKEVIYWFSGENTYKNLRTAVYPPASYVMFWPLMGWLSFGAARWFWSFITILALIALARLSITAVGVDSKLGKTVLALIPLAIYPTGASIGNGQLPVFVITLIIFSIINLCNAKSGWLNCSLVAGAFLFALVKPTLTAPFFWIILFAGFTLRPAILVIAGYALLSLIAGAFQPTGLVDLNNLWLNNALNGLAYGTNREGGYSNLHGLLNQLGLNGWNLDVSLIVFFFLGIWTYIYRKADIWLLMSISALIARFWTYHMWYDDLLILIPMIALLRIAKKDYAINRRIEAAGILVALSIPLMMAPGGLYLFPPPWNMIYVFAQKILWLAMLCFLIKYAHREKLSQKRMTTFHATL